MRLAVHTQHIDEIQSRFKCCGRLSFADWRNSSTVNPSKKFLFLNNDFLLASNQIAFNVPDSCCIQTNESCGKQLPAETSIFGRGCLAPLNQFLANLLFFVYVTYAATFCIISSSIVYFLLVSLAVKSDYNLIRENFDENNATNKENSK